MSKKKILCLGLLAVVLVIFLFCFYQKWRVDHAIIKVTLKDALEAEVYSEVKVSDFIEEINGTLVKDEKRDTSKVGSKEDCFQFINEEKIKVPYTFTIQIMDNTPPTIRLGRKYSVPVYYEGNIEEEIFCGDNYDDDPTCKIEGEYDVNTAGNYSLTYMAEDSSGNQANQDFTLSVYEPTALSKENQEENGEVQYTDFQDVVARYKKENTKIGIDVSHWQGDIDFAKVKEAGVEFAFIRVGTSNGIKGDYILDKKFKQNIDGFLAQDIPVGIYFYSYANSTKQAEKDAKWVLKQIKDYDITLPVAFDWESWGAFQEFHLSFYHLTEVANTFLKKMEKEGYQGMLYSSKTYLESIWYPTSYEVWLAHYTDETDYEGAYQVWQLCNNGKVDGISSAVDIDIMYE